MAQTLVSSTSERLAQGGTVMGVFADATYAHAEMRIDLGDRLLFYTDGVTEARNAVGEEFGMDRLADVAARSNARTAEDTKNSVMTELMALTGGAFDDDSTLIVVEIVPPDAVALERSAC